MKINTSKDMKINTSKVFLSLFTVFGIPHDPKGENIGTRIRIRIIIDTDSKH